MPRCVDHLEPVVVALEDITVLHHLHVEDRIAEHGEQGEAFPDLRHLLGRHVHQGHQSLARLVEHLLAVRLRGHPPCVLGVDEARDRAAHFLPNPGREAEVIDVPMGKYDSFDIGQVASGLFEPTLQGLEGPREFGGRVDQGQRPRTDGIDIRRNQVGIAGQVDCNRDRRCQPLERAPICSSSRGVTLKVRYVSERFRDSVLTWVPSPICLGSVSPSPYKSRDKPTQPAKRCQEPFRMKSPGTNLRGNPGQHRATRTTP